MSLSTTFQDQLEEENGHPRQQRQLPAVMTGRVGHNKFTSALSQIKGYLHRDLKLTTPKTV